MSEQVKSEQFPHAELIFVTAEMARKWLRLNIENNRPIVETRKQDFLRDMKSDRWKKNGSTLVFTGPSAENPGKLIDGQHRLLACAEGGVGFWTLVAFGVDEDAFITIDRGQSRTTGQMLHLQSGVSDYNAVAATLVWLYRFRDGIMLNSGRPTTGESADLLQANHGIPESVSIARRVNSRFKAGPLPVIAICHYLFSRQDATLAEAFFDALATGASLREVDPVYHLRARIIASAGSSSKRISSYELLALMFKTWLAEREQRIMKGALRWVQAESFPNIGPVPNVNKIRTEKISPSAHAGRKRGPNRVHHDVPVHKVEPPKQPATKLDQLIQKHQGLDRRPN